MATKKLDKEHVEAIAELRANFRKNSNILGALAIDEHLMTSQLEQLKQVREEKLAEFENLRKQETELVETLKEKYGEGEINIVDGTFTPSLTSLSSE
jgi:DNA-binding PucR family transcriptional regulator